ncbi:YcnI family protein [Kocuria arenosa]|uniref:YcnI family copper-binding membrane protein n=1 Tax=Kocuria arenosa TaxID=3071446 RepID=UPI0034D474BE
MTNFTSTARWTKGASAAAVAAGLMATGLSPAAAHVSATATSTAAGGYTQITFSVPNESDTASTTKLELTLPEDTPFASVRTQPVEGWNAEITEEELATPATVGEGAITEAASTITWTADAEHAIAPGEFQTFTISVGPLPGEEGKQIVLPVSQTYTDGRTVAWDQPATEGGEEPEHPAPSLTVTAAETDGHGAPHGAATVAEQPEQTSAPSTGGNTLGWVGLIAGLLGLAAGLTALARTRRRG